MKLSKLDVAKRELEFSIRLFFLSGDPIIIHLVTSAALNIIRDLCKKKGIKTFMDQFLSRVKPEKHKLVIDKLHEAQNFMKHADRDEDKLLDFNPELTDFTLWECVDLYYQLAKEVTGIMQAYRLFIYLKYPDLLEDLEAKELFEQEALKLDINSRNQFLDLAKILEERRTN